jgi:hypothetical protein
MNNILSFIKKYPEVLAIPTALIFWKLSVYVLRFLDPTSGIYDAGIFQIPIFAAIQFFVFVSIAWLTMKLLYGTLRQYLRFGFKVDFQDFTGWQKAKLAFFVFFALVFLLAYLAHTLITK